MTGPGMTGAGMRGVAGALVLALLLVLAPAAAVVAEPAAEAADRAVVDPPDELDPAEDNAAEGHDTCGGEPTAPSGSRIVRALVDGPRHPDGALAFTSGVCIYLPPGYDDGSHRYPVLYLLHGAFGWQDDWLVQGDAQAILDRVRAADPAADLIVVMPDGGYDGRWLDDGGIRHETYVVDHVIPYVDRWFRTIPDRRGRAMSGLSNGGAGTLRMAAHHPDLFGVVTAMSPATPVNTAADRTDVHAVWNDPTEVAANLNEVELAIIYGLTCGTPEECQANAAGYAFEGACCTNEVYRAKLEAVRDRPYRYEATDGAHTWYFWQRWLEFSHGAYLREHLADPMPVDAALPPLDPPTSFDLRSIHPVVGAYDHTFATDPGRAVEHLTLADVSRDGFTVTGSGALDVTTAARYAPGVAYTVEGTGVGPSGGPDGGPGGAARQVVADAAGRLSFEVDLGPAHRAPEGSPQARLDEVAAAGSYWTTRTVRISAGPEVGGTLEHVYLPGESHEYHYYLYTPAGYDPATPMPLQLVIHGANTVALEQVMANGHHAVADREGFMVLYPDFVNEADPDPGSGESTPESLVGSHPGRLWDSYDMTSRATGTGDAAAIVRMVERVARDRALDRDRVYVSGMSSGAMMTSHLLGLYPDVFAAGAIVAGCAFGTAGCATPDLPGQDEALARAAHVAQGAHARIVPVVVLHGDLDTTISPEAGARAVRQWLMTGNLASVGTTQGPLPLIPTSSREGRREGGHTWTVEEHRTEAGCLVAEHWRIHGMGHFWPGGVDDPAWAEWTDWRGPSGAEATWAFFARHRLDGDGLVC
jgi:poly(hydroxyalkanoate) depolymerase family esterase